MTISVIAAITNNNAIGRNNELLFRIKEDLKRFRELTTGNVVIMGMNTYLSIGKPLPNRVNLILSSKNENNDENIFSSMEECLEYCRKYYDDKEIFIIGGGMVYKTAMETDIADKLYITRIYATVEDADTFFPEIDEDKWELTEKDVRFDENLLKYEFQNFVKKDSKTFGQSEIM